MKIYTVFIAAVAALGGLLFGFDTAVIAGTISPLKTFFELSDSAIGFLVASSSIGCIPGAFLAGRLADRYGRKNMMAATALVFIISAIGSGIAGSFTELVTYRFVGGIAIGMASALVPIYISEIAPPAFRGRLGMLQQLAIVVGILLAFIYAAILRACKIILRLFFAAMQVTLPPSFSIAETIWCFHGTK